MTMRKLPIGGMWTPLPINFPAGTTPIDLKSVLYMNNDAPAEKVFFSFYAPVSGTLDMFEFQMDASDCDPATTLKVSFQDLDSSNLPDGTADQYRIITVGSFGSWVDPGLMTSDGTDNGVKRTVTRGQKLACVIEFNTSDPTDVIYIGSIGAGDDRLRVGSGGAGYHDGGSWIRVSTYGACALRYDGTIYYPMPEFIPANSLTASPVNTGTAPDEIGLEFSFQAPVRIGSASFCLNTAVNGAGWDCVVYDETGAVKDTVSVKLFTDLLPTSGYIYSTVKFSQDIFVPANVPYRVTLKPTSASTINIMEMYLDNTTLAFNVYGYLDTGSNQHSWMHVERTDAGDFETTDTIIPLISINVTGSDMDAGGAQDDWTGDA